MATKIICDGCGTEITGEVRGYGVAEIREYCETCVPKVEAYLAARDELHGKLAKAWVTGNEKLRKSAGLVLPDE